MRVPSDAEERLAARFWAKVDQGDAGECWPWTGYVRPSGHGGTTYKCFSILASRKAWILTHGPISSEVCVNHRCDNALCCNPAHMYLGTRADNMIDRWSNPEPAERMARGRPTSLTDAQLEEMWRMRQEGATLEECAKQAGVHRATVGRYITARRRKSIDRLQAVRLALARRSEA